MGLPYPAGIAGTPASDTPRPGSARAGGLGLGWPALLCRAVGDFPHYSAAPLAIFSGSRSVHHGDCEHHHDGRGERAHDGERHDFLSVFHRYPHRSLAFADEHLARVSVRRNRIKSFPKTGEPFCGGPCYRSVELIWCGRRDLNPHGPCAQRIFLPATAFAAPASEGVWGLDYPFTVPAWQFRR